VRILIPTADYPPIEGGLSTVAVQLARETAALGHEVTVVAPHFTDQEEFDAGEPIEVLRYGGYGLGWLRVLPMWWRCRPLLRSTDLILAINASHGGLIGWWTGRPYITFAYAYEFLKFGARSLAARLLRRVYGRAVAVVAISNYTRERLITFGVDAEQAVTIYPGTAEARAVSNGALAQLRERLCLGDGPVILSVGRFIRRKGHATLVRAMPRILERHPTATLVLVGRGSELAPVTRDAQRLGVRDHVRFPGPVSDEDLATLYTLCDVFALPTGEGDGGHVEGFGLVFTEAQAYGKPVVAGDSGGVPEAVLDGKTGLLVPPNRPEAAARVVLQLLDDKELAARLGAAGKHRVETELSWSRFAEQLLEIIEQ
jgi:phosphatidyl-myo-inositol dimannoside synthase